MQPEPSVEVPTFIPDHIAKAYRDEVVEQVTESWAARPAPAPKVVEPAVQRVPPPPTASDLLLILAVNIALVGWAVCTGWWAWLAVDTGSLMWITIASAGAVGLGVGTFAAIRFWLSTADVRSTVDEVEQRPVLPAADRAPVLYAYDHEVARRPIR